ncbi:MAG: FtsX-like permease family protein [Gemmatimonadetes bacterium]|nr:FtsX-like permease family protein [Gemmatimonadota bacterium]NIR76953.1 FtsX-like permease family protein [Gemmatimonadota bacterium]NIT85482.1 FtsX-like permease family protein [Gemmatimonadota bacterium]NIU29306.1 FtsX-like permease family protein [Gemmatimonadota bacterium]NIU34383.1 FtsX-like permease family protein [Gemmatimonadota bacterium]
MAAGLLTRSLANARSVDPGVDVDRLAAIGTNLRQGNVPREEWSVVMEEALRRVRAIPGVRRAAIASRLPVQGFASATTVLEGYDPPSGTDATELDFALVSRDYFRTVGIPVVAGRTFSDEDRPESPLVVLVNETAAQRFWGGDAVGRRLRPQGAEDAWRRLVGVVGDATVEELQEPPTPILYYSADQRPLSRFFVVARTDGDPAALTGPLREELRAVGSSLPITELGTLESHLGQSLSGPRTAATLVGVFSLLAVLLASLGIYAVVSFTVARRSSEMGIRVALGAERSRVVGMVVAESMTSVAVGLLAGVGLALVAVRGLESVLYRVGALDPATFGAGAAGLLAVAALASWIPARRAARSDPVEVLRAQ